MSFANLYGPDPPVPDYPVCPLCDVECQTIYYSCDGDILGCEHCVSSVDAWEWQAEEDKNAGPDPDRRYDEYKERESA
ncbi:MAG: hypothetical protein CVU99_02635 [Firmicutes bacterium HGW-Firmicutes-4]|jgi:hypothetical protein|nr:MAG: hypothetical protein CVU99_02635 [Firmicutes bacterium HGW-Firmicutes-4]